jgi:hypothetical protein
MFSGVFQVGVANLELEAEQELVDVPEIRRLFSEFMAEHGHPEEPPPSMDEIERTFSRTRYLP